MNGPADRRARAVTHRNASTTDAGPPVPCGARRSGRGGRRRPRPGSAHNPSPSRSARAEDGGGFPSAAGARPPIEAPEPCRLGPGAGLGAARLRRKLPPRTDRPGTGGGERGNGLRRSERAFGYPGRVPATTWQPSLLAFEAGPAVDASFDGARRRFLGRGAWVDVVPGWVHGADALFSDILEAAPWKSRTRRMWDSVVDEPRLTTGAWDDAPPPVPTMADALSARYGLDLSSVSANLYRDGADSVAWHGDTSGRRRDTTIVAIVSLGAPRRFLLRPKGGGSSVRYLPAHGDLVVLGGTCQRTWDHCVPKRAAAGSRISLMFREPGVF